MKVTKTLILIGLIIFSFLFSCSRKDVKNISVNGIVKNSLTNQPIEGSTKLKIECWKYANSSDQSYGDFEIRNIETNTNGSFLINFDKGALLIFKVDKKGFKKFVKKMYIKNSNSNYEINLIPQGE